MHISSTCLAVNSKDSSLDVVMNRTISPLCPPLPAFPQMNLTFSEEIFGTFIAKLNLFEDILVAYKPSIACKFVNYNSLPHRTLPCPIPHPPLPFSLLLLPPLHSFQPSHRWLSNLKFLLITVPDVYVAYSLLQCETSTSTSSDLLYFLRIEIFRRDNTVGSCMNPPYQINSGRNN